MDLDLKPGMRVRCVNNTQPWPALHLTIGAEYTVTGTDGPYILIDMGFTKEHEPYFCERFKPVVRVKAKCVPDKQSQRAAWVKGWN